MNLCSRSVTPGESPPPPPRACFGRNELIEKVVGFAENLESVALIGAGGIGKTSIALTVLHHDRIKGRFGDNRRFIRCDQFPASRAHFLARLSDVIGAGVENLDDLTPLRSLLSSKETLIVLDNTESILDPQGANAREIYAVVDELCRFKTISVCITSRITTIPQPFKRLVVPTLSAEAACDTFYSIYNDRGRSDIIKDLLQRLDYHPLSITLLAVAASHVEPSLASPTFQELGPDARELLGVVAFFPQGVGEKNLDWLFPTIPNRKIILDKFCVLSLTHQVDGFITMPSQIRDYLCPRDPRSSPLLCETKRRYFTRLSVFVNPGVPGFEETEWIKLEDANVERLLDVFIPIDTTTDDTLDVCAHFMRHLYRHKPRQTALGPMIEGLPDDHPSKIECLIQLSRLFGSVGNNADRKRILSQALKLEKEKGDDYKIARTLRLLSDANQALKIFGEGIQQAREALGIYERLGDTAGQAESLGYLARLLWRDKQVDAAEEAVARAMNLLPVEGQEFQVCQYLQLLGNISRSKGEREKAIRNFEVAIKMASPLNWHIELFWTHCSLATLFHDKGALDEAHAHIRRAKSHAVGPGHLPGNAEEFHVQICYRQGKLGEAWSEVLRAKEVFEKLGSATDVQDCQDLFHEIRQAERLASLE